jgi:hypothetical protein
MAPIDEALEEIESRVFTRQIPYTQIALKHSVVATTLRRQHLGETQPRSLQNVQQQLLTPKQEIELVRWIDKETQGHQPPGQLLVKQKASLLAGKPVSNH